MMSHAGWRLLLHPLPVDACRVGCCHAQEPGSVIDAVILLEQWLLYTLSDYLPILIYVCKHDSLRLQGTGNRCLFAVPSGRQHSIAYPFPSKLHERSLLYMLPRLSCEGMHKLDSTTQVTMDKSLTGSPTAQSAPRRRPMRQSTPRDRWPATAGRRSAL